jgi:hypothetical protein
MKALAEAATKDGRSSTAATSGALRHCLTSVNTGASAEFVLQDLNDLMTRMRRVNVSWAGGTPSDYNAKGLTDMFVSPEVKGQIRKFAYNALRSDSGATAANAQNLPDDARMSIFNAAGMESIYGVAIHELVELGESQRYNALFETFFDSVGTAATNLDGSSNSISNFATASHQILVGVDLGREAFVRPVARDADTGSQFTAVPDDQWYASRSDKAGFYGSLEEGRLCLDGRAVCGTILG